MPSLTSFTFAASTMLAALLQVRADTCAGPAQAVPLYRSFNSAGIDHFYTVDLAEYNTANTEGYAGENVRALVFTTQVPGSVRLHRLWNGGVVDHFYTTSDSEAAAATKGGYVSEDNAGHTPIFVYPTALCGSIPLFRSYAGGNATDHFYTVDAAERDAAVKSGWAIEGIAGYVFAADAAESTTAQTTPASLTTAAQTTPAKTTPSTTATADINSSESVKPAVTSLLSEGQTAGISTDNETVTGVPYGNSAGVLSLASSVERVFVICGLLVGLQVLCFMI